MPKPELLWTIYTSTELACANAYLLKKQSAAAMQTSVLVPQPRHRSTWFLAGPRLLAKLEKLARVKNGARCEKTLKSERVPGRLHAVTSIRPAIS